jgi:hypothetical protein
MKLFISIAGERRGPFSLRNLHEMKALGSLAEGTLVWTAGNETWIPLDEFLLQHPITEAELDPNGIDVKPRGASRIRGLAGALTAGILGGGMIAGLAAWTGLLVTLLWWVLGWATGALARSWGRTANDQVIGLFASAATFLGMMISVAGIESRPQRVIMLGPLGLLISLVGSIWLAFKTGSTPP